MKNKRKTIVSIVVASMLILFVVVGFVIGEKRRASTEAANLAIGSPKDHKDYQGRLQITSADIDIALICADTDEAAQTVVDASDCGIYMTHTVQNNWVIGDHDYQGFSNISNLEKGDKITITNKDNSSTEYIVTRSFIGWNDGGLTDFWKNPLTKETDGGILYTCFLGNKIVQIVYCDVDLSSS